jgi:hypothetical protein
MRYRRLTSPVQERRLKPDLAGWHSSVERYPSDFNGRLINTGTITYQPAGADPVNAHIAIPTDNIGTLKATTEPSQAPTARRRRSHPPQTGGRRLRPTPRRAPR